MKTYYCKINKFFVLELLSCGYIKSCILCKQYCLPFFISHVDSLIELYEKNV